MSSSYCPLTLPERDMLAWYRLPEPIQHPVCEIATFPVSREPLAEDTPAASIDMPIAA
jgi:hypothetical protein